MIVVFEVKDIFVVVLLLRLVRSVIIVLIKIQFNNLVLKDFLTHKLQKLEEMIVRDVIKVIIVIHKQLERKIQMMNV